MKLCEWVVIDSGMVKCGKPATRRIPSTAAPVCEGHYQLDKRLRKK